MDRITAGRPDRFSAYFSLNNLGRILTILALTALTAAAWATPSLSGISCGKSSYSSNGTDACTVSLSSKAIHNVSVTLASNDGAVIVPGSVTVGAGATSAAFTTTVLGVSTAQTATITAHASGSAKTFNIALSPATTGSATLSAISCAGSSYNGNATDACAVYLSSAATSNINVSLSSNDGAVIVPSGVTVSAGSTSAAFTTTVLGVSTAQTATITANAGGVAKTFNITLSPATSGSATLNAISCVGSSYNGNATDACAVYLSSAATSNVNVSLSTNDGAVIVPSGVTVSAGSTSAAFTTTVLGVSTAQTATITANAGGVAKTFNITLSPTGTGTAALSLSATSLSFGNVAVGTAVSQSVTVTSSGTAAVTINSDSISGTGFSVSGGSLPVTLNPGQALVLSIQFDPANAGSSSGQLSISSNGSAATVSVSGTGTTVAPTVSAVTCSSTSITGALADDCAVILTGSAPSGGVGVALGSSSSAVAIPGSITVPAAASTAAFTANVLR